jgi:hypothetical protein
MGREFEHAEVVEVKAEGVPLIEGLAYASDDPTPRQNGARPNPPGGSFLGPREDPSVRPSQAEVVNRARQEILRQQASRQAPVGEISNTVQQQGNFENAAGTKVANFLQTYHKQNGNNLALSRNQIARMNAEFDQLAAPGGPHYRLSWRSAGNNVHLELTDINVRYQPQNNVNPGQFQTQEQRNRFAETETARHRGLSFKGSLDFNIALTPEASNTIKAQADLVATDLKNNNQLNGNLVDRAFASAIQNRSASDAQGKEVMQTLITEINGKLEGSPYKLTPLYGNDRRASQDLADYMRGHPNAQAMLVLKDNRPLQPYAFDPTDLLQNAGLAGRPGADSPRDQLVDRIGRLGQFSDPASGANRHSEYTEALQRFQSQANPREFVKELNEKLQVSGSKYHLEVNQQSPYRPMQISIIDENRRQTDFIQIRGPVR